MYVDMIIVIALITIVPAVCGIIGVMAGYLMANLTRRP